MFKQLVLLRPVATFFALVTFAIAMALGFWQVDRMDQKLSLAADIAKKKVQFRYWLMQSNGLMRKPSTIVWLLEVYTYPMQRFG